MSYKGQSVAYLSIEKTLYKYYNNNRQKARQSSARQSTNCDRQTASRDESFIQAGNSRKQALSEAERALCFAKRCGDEATLC